MTSTATETLVSLADIARLARVQRPVVSMWRKRPAARGEIIPFPQPRATHDAHEVFDLAEVLGWLERTGRGNNPDARIEAPLALRVPARHGGETATLEAVLALSSLPVLRAIGVAVSLGVVSNFVLALLLTRPRREVAS